MLYNQALVRNRKVTGSLDPLAYPGNSGGEKKAEEALHRKSAQTVILKDKKVVGRSPPPPLSPAYIGPLSKIVIYAVF